jgi:hypothetical protein
MEKDRKDEEIFGEKDFFVVLGFELKASRKKLLGEILCDAN